MAKLKIKKETPEKGFTILRLSGEFEGLSIVEAKDELFDLLRKEARSEFVLDFGEIVYIDSAGIGVLLEMAKAADEQRVKFGLINVNPQVKKVIVVTKVDKILKIYE